MESRDTLNQKAYETIKDAILSRKLAPGTRIVDTRIAEIFGISRTPARDAIQLLVSEGLIERGVGNSRRGYFVVSITAEDIKNYYDICIMLDREIITQIVEALYKDKIRKVLQDTYDELCQLGEEDFIETEHLYHSSIISLCENAQFAKIYSEVRNHTRIFRDMFTMSSERKKRSEEAHRIIIQAILEGNLTKALSEAKDFMTESRENGLNDLAKDSGYDWAKL